MYGAVGVGAQAFYGYQCPVFVVVSVLDVEALEDGDSDLNIRSDPCSYVLDEKGEGDEG